MKIQINLYQCCVKKFLLAVLLSFIALYSEAIFSQATEQQAVSTPEIENLSIREIESKAKQAFIDNNYREAFKLYTYLVTVESSKSGSSWWLRRRLSNYVLQKARCEYYLQRFTDAAKTLNSHLDKAHDRFAYRFLLGKIYFDDEKFEPALQVLSDAVQNAGWGDDIESVQNKMARTYEEIAFKAYLSGNKETNKKYLEKALQTLYKIRERRANPLTHPDPLRHRIVFLEEKLKSYELVGIQFPQEIQAYSQTELTNLLKQYLSPEQAQQVPYSFEIDGTMREYVQTHLQNTTSELEKARKLFRIIRSESFLRTAEMYDQYLYTQKKRGLVWTHCKRCIPRALPW